MSSTEPIYPLPADWPKRCNCFLWNPLQLLLQVLKAGPNIVPSSPLGEALRLLPGETVHTQANAGADVPKVKSWNMPNLFIQRVFFIQIQLLKQKKVSFFIHTHYISGGTCFVPRWLYPCRGGSFQVLRVNFDPSNLALCITGGFRQWPAISLWWQAQTALEATSLQLTWKNFDLLPENLCLNCDSKYRSSSKQAVISPIDLFHPS